MTGRRLADLSARRLRWCPWLGLWILGIPAAEAQAPPPAPAPPVIELAESTVTIRGVTSGGRTLLFGLAQERPHHVLTIVRREEVLEDADGDGTAVHELDRPVPFASLWVAVDLTTGGAAVAAPEGFPLRELPPPVEVTAESLDVAVSMAELVLVRPGVGAWGSRAGDGGAADQDGEENGVTRMGIADLWAIADSPLADGLALADIAAVIEPNELAVSVGRLDGSGRGE